MRIKLLLLLLLLATSATFSQTCTPVTLATLPTVLHETSGLLYHSKTSYWSHGDGGNPNAIYKLDSSGALLKTLTISNATNNDWEEITEDASRTYCYIGNFGNNCNCRQNLSVLKILNPDHIAGTSTTASFINFSYPDQTSFPPGPMNQNFDCEAMIHVGDSLYIFSKNNIDGKNSSRYSKLYSIPDQPGTYTSHLIDSTYTNYRITGAALSPNGQSIVLMSYGHFIILKNWTGNNFFSGTKTTLSFGQGGQTESVAYRDNNSFYMTNENTGTGSKLYLVDITAYAPAVSVVTANLTMPADNAVTLTPNPSTGLLSLKVDVSNLSSAMVNVFNSAGTFVKQQIVSTINNSASLTTNELANGTYYVQIDLNGTEKLVEVMQVSH